jgi:hypothetical protein
MLTPLPFTRLVLTLAVLAIGATSWLLEYRAGRLEELRAWMRARRWLLLALEVVFLSGFVLFAVLRSHAPAVIATEKPMDMAFLNGFIAAQRLPTQDTWLAGFGVPYYHFGYFVLACVAKLSGVSPGVAYNLAAAVVPALTMVGLAALAWNLARAAGVQVAWSGQSVDVLRAPGFTRHGGRRRGRSAWHQELRRKRGPQRVAAAQQLLVVLRLARHSQPAARRHQRVPVLLGAAQRSASALRRAAVRAAGGVCRVRARDQSW